MTKQKAREQKVRELSDAYGAVLRMDEVEWNNEKFAILMCPTVSFKKKIKFIADCEDVRARVAADRAERRRAIPFD